MTGDDSFHAECFTCRSCKNRIDELVFAKTSQGFYCMKCHNERVARSRRHLAKQKQKERERAAAAQAAGRGSSSAAGSEYRVRFVVRFEISVLIAPRLISIVTVTIY